MPCRSSGDLSTAAVGVGGGGNEAHRAQAAEAEYPDAARRLLAERYADYGGSVDEDDDGDLFSVTQAPTYDF
jgi:hypothetical protein